MAGPTVSAPRVEAIIFDMDGTMVDSMPWHARAWGEFARRRGLALDVDDLMRRTTGRNAYECACELMERVVSAEESAAITHEKESIYRELFGAAFAEVPGFRAFVAADDGLPGKPRPDIFLEAARRIGVAPAHCVVFEDAPFGIEAARRAGMRAVAVCTTHTPDELAGPHVVAAVRTYDELVLSDFLETFDAATA
jgi:beta-phosphoglucomutase-like phosphatase (HAD superfamily)